MTSDTPSPGSPRCAFARCSRVWRDRRFGCRDPAGHGKAGAKDLPHPGALRSPQPGATTGSCPRHTPAEMPGSDQGHGVRGARRDRRGGAGGRGGAHHHLDVPVVDGDAADVGGGLPVGDAVLVQLTASQDEAWGGSGSARAPLLAGHPAPCRNPARDSRPEPSGRDPQPQNRTRPRLSGGFADPLPIQSPQPQPPTQCHPWGGRWHQAVGSLNRGHA